MPTISKRGKNYNIRVSCGYDGTGKRIVKSMTFKLPPFTPKKEEERLVQKAAYEFEERCLKGQVVDSGIQFRDFVDKWIKEYAEKQLRASTLSRYKELLKRIMPVFGNMKLSAIRPFALTEFYNRLSEEGERQDNKYTGRETVIQLMKNSGMTHVKLAKESGVCLSVVDSVLNGRYVSEKSAEKISAYFDKPIEMLFRPKDQGRRLASRSVQYYHVVLSSIFSTAVRWEFLSENPCSRVRPPKTIYKESRYLDENEAAAVMEALAKEPYRYAIAIYIMLYTGLRRGEVCGLEWSDIDFDKRIMSINRSSLYIPEKGTFTDSLKTYNSARVIRLSDGIIDILKDYREWQQDQAKQTDNWKNSDRLLTMLDGAPMCPDSLSRWFYKFIRQNGLPQISLHSLRHTHATLLIACGIPLKNVSARLGHASIITTSNIYVHAIQSVDAMSADAIDSVLTPHKPGGIKSDIKINKNSIA